ncbi:MerR family transcriptional regulator [Microbacterium halophytorum]|uniref:MerR family transcriptional regulator n=1 Tax=Microbacterium halophytorum TaxID=2067568 RepID=UPI0018E093BB|nr:MerR family transcriptional regulator [Microbacterium halophytorum]
MTDPDRVALSIGELSERTGASVRALRHYEQHGVLTAHRSAAGHRRFAADAVETVRRIRMFLDAGLSLAVVAQIMPCFVDDGARLDACIAGYLSEHMGALRQRIDQLDEQRGTIERLQELVLA